jgi:hypothetical protein
MSILDIKFYVDRVSNYLIFFVFILGFVGNIFAYKIYSRRTLKKTSFGIYFRVASLVDFLICLNCFTYLLQNVFKYDIHLLAEFICKTLDYTDYVAAPISGYLLVFISIDRFLKIKFPRKFKFLFEKKFQISLIAFLFAYNILFYVGFLWNKQLEKTFNVDNATNETTAQLVCQDLPLMETFYQMDVFNSALVPYCFMIFFSSATIITVFRSRNRINLTSHSEGISKRDRKFAFTSVALNTMFLFLNLPDVLLIAYGGHLDSDLFNMIYYIFNVLYYANYANSFYTQLYFNTIFRNEFFLILNLKPIKTRGDQHDASTDDGATHHH